MNRDHAVGFGIGVLTGAVIGGVIALLFAPQSGKDTRQMIREKAVDAYDTVKDKAVNVAHAIKS